MGNPNAYDPEQLHRRLKAVEARIQQAAERSGRDPADVTLVAVSKTHPVEAIEALYDAGHRSFGESYVQEWQAKAAALPDDIAWHFIGHLQSNKAKYLSDRIALVHSIDRRSVMKALHKRADRPIDVLLQVNVAQQASKSGVEPQKLQVLCEEIARYTQLRPRGLMTIPPYVEDPEENRPHFKAMVELFSRARAWLEGQGVETGRFEHLSMGMTGDFEVAVEEGASIVRVGTGIFGARSYDG